MGNTLPTTKQTRTIKCRHLQTAFSLQTTCTNLNAYSAAQKTVFGPEGRKMQATVWREVLSVLKEKMPEVGDLSS